MGRADKRARVVAAARWTVPRGPQLLTLIALLASAVMLASVRALHAAWYGPVPWPWAVVACWLGSLIWVQRHGMLRAQLALGVLGATALGLRLLPFNADPAAMAVIPLCAAVGGLVLARFPRGRWPGAVLGLAALLASGFSLLQAVNAVTTLPTAWRLYDQRVALCALPPRGPGIEHLCEDVVCVRCTDEGGYDYIVVWGTFDPAWMIDSDGQLY